MSDLSNINSDITPDSESTINPVIRGEFEDNNTWNSDLEKMAKEIGENAASFKWMHDFEANLFTILNHCFGLCAVIFGALTIITSGMLAMDKYNDLDSIFILNLGLSAIATIFAGLKQFLPWNSLITKHNNAGVRYHSLMNRVRIQLALYREDRLSGKVFVEDIMRELNILYATSPGIHWPTSRTFSLRFRNKSIAKPDMISGVSPIHIRKEDSTDRSVEECIESKINTDYLISLYRKELAV
jgi:hypothetical protein